jgi:hypothetical protein
MIQIGTMTGSTKSMMVNALDKLAKSIQNSTDSKKGFAFYRGVVYSYDDDTHISLLGSNIDGVSSIVKLAFGEDGSVKGDVNGFVDLSVVREGVDNLLDVLSRVNGLTVSKIYFDFNENTDVGTSKCFLYADIEEEGSKVVMIETDPQMVNNFMLSSMFNICKGSLLSDCFSDVYNRLHNYKGSASEKAWFKSRGVLIE